MRTDTTHSHTPGTEPHDFFEEVVEDITSVVEEARRDLEALLYRFEGDSHPLSCLRRTDIASGNVYRNLAGLVQALSDFDPTSTRKAAP